MKRKDILMLVTRVLLGMQVLNAFPIVAFADEQVIDDFNENNDTHISSDEGMILEGGGIEYTDNVCSPTINEDIIFNTDDKVEDELFAEEDSSFDFDKSIKCNNETVFDSVQLGVVEDNWLNREVARQVLGDTDRFSELTEAHYQSVKSIIIHNETINDIIPSDLSKLINLEVLHINGSGLRGNIPSTINNLINLVELDLGQNELTGYIPEEVYLLENLKTLRLYGNSLKGTVSPNIKNLKNLEFMSYGRNNISGTIPKEVLLLDKLQFFSLAYNDIVGEIDIPSGSMPNLTELYLNGNRMTGVIKLPAENKSKWVKMNLSDNQFIGVDENYPDSQKIEGVLAGNFVEGVPNQKEIVICNAAEEVVEIGDKVIIPSFDNSDVTVKWANGTEPLDLVYHLETMVDNMEIIDSSMVAIEEGTISIKAKIKTASSMNTSAQSTNSRTIVVNRKYVPMDISVILSTTEWTNKDVSVEYVVTGSDDVDYVELPDGTKVSDSQGIFSLTENGDYIFKVVSVVGDEKEIVVNINNIDKVAPTIDSNEDIVVSGNIIRIDISRAENLSGIGRIILPNGDIIENPTDDFIEYEADTSGVLRFTLVDNAGNEFVLDYEFEYSTENEDGDKGEGDNGGGSSNDNDNDKNIPNTGGYRHLVILFGILSGFTGINMIKKRK